MAGASHRLRALQHRISRLAHGTRSLPLLRAAHRAVVSVEVAVARAVHRPRRGGPVAPESLTLVIKTFERPAVLRRMLASVRRVYAGPIVIADDSATGFVTDDPLVTVLRLPFDSGIGAGRNRLLAAVDTEYVWMADDDMIVLPDLDVSRIVAWLDRNPDVDLVGGRVVNLPQVRSADYASAALFAYRGRPRAVEGTIIDGLPVLYKVPNFYIARTAQVRAVGYDDRLKRVDHNDFFTSAYGRLVCTFDKTFVCLHAHSYFDPHYQRFRMDTAADLALLAEKWRPEPASPAAVGAAVPDAALRAFHHAALQTVADDLGVSLVHGDPDAAVRVTLGEADLARFTETLTQIGWRRAGRSLTHPLWGEATLAAGPDGGVRASFAGVHGRAGSPGRWPEPVDPGPAGEGVRWAGRTGHIAGAGGVHVALLPRGPVFSLEPPADAIWDAVGPTGRPEADIVAAVLGGYPDAPPDAADHIRACLTDLGNKGLVAGAGR